MTTSSTIFLLDNKKTHSGVFRRIPFSSSMMSSSPVSLCLCGSISLLLCLSAEAESARELVRQGNRSYAKGDYTSALGAYGKASAGAPDNAIVAFDRGDALFKKGDFAKSLEYSSRKADMTPTEAQGYVFIGALCWQRSYQKVDPPEARAQVVEKGAAALDKALAINPESFEGLLYKNLILRQKSELSKIAADNERKDKKKKKALEDEAAAYIAQAEELRKQAIEVKKKQSQQPQQPKPANQPASAPAQK